MKKIMLVVLLMTEMLSAQEGSVFGGTVFQLNSRYTLSSTFIAATNYLQTQINQLYSPTSGVTQSYVEENFLPIGWPNTNTTYTTTVALASTAIQGVGIAEGQTTGITTNGGRILNITIGTNAQNNININLQSQITTLDTGKVSKTDSTYTSTVAKASSALQVEADTNALTQLSTHVNNSTNFHGLTYSNGTLSVSNGISIGDTTLYWDGALETQTLKYIHPDGGEIEVNGEIYRMWKNVDSVVISNGQPVCIYGGSGRVASVRLADADDLEANCVIGVYTATNILQVGAIGRITVGTGTIREAPLDHFVVGGVLSENNKMFLATQKGMYTTNSQTYPAENILVGICIYAHQQSHTYDMELAIHHIKTWDMLDAQYKTVATTNTTAGSNLVGKLRYYTTSSNSFVDVCMQTGSNTYSWVNIQSYGW